MCTSRYLRAFGLCLLLAVAVIESAEDCDKTKCKGPLRFYEDLNCKPVYEKEGDCCPLRYDCSHLNGRSAQKCYSNGREYAVGEHLRAEDRPSGCDVGCRCIADQFTGEAQFLCDHPDCFDIIPKRGCYVRHGHDTCCLGKEVCPVRGRPVPRCVVDGRTYRDGQKFTVKDDPSLVCYCMEGYKGENVAPFCKKATCSTEMRHGHEIRKNCVPVFYYIQRVRSSCSFSFICQNDDDEIVHTYRQSAKSSVKKVSDDMMCKFGNLTMRIGDELKYANNHKSTCMKCVCEVPPTPTCTRLYNDKCDSRS